MVHTYFPYALHKGGIKMPSLTIKPASCDTFISQEAGHNSNYKKDFLLAGNSSQTYRTYLLFDLSRLPLHINIITAKLCLQVFRNEFRSGSTIEVLQILSNWQEKRLSWDAQPIYDHTPTDSLILANPCTGTITFDMTALMQKWHQGIEANLGILLKALNENKNNLLWMKSSRFENSRDWPSISLEYIEPACTSSLSIIDTKECYIANYQCQHTPASDVLLYNYAYIVTNIGANPVEIHLEVSADSANWQQDTLPEIVNPGATSFFINNTITRYEVNLSNHAVW
jgi:hypothetical protein